MRAFTQVEYDILNSVYFVEPFEKILEEVDAPQNIVTDGLRFLIEHKFVVAMRWSERKNEYERTFFYDADNMHAFHYLATKEGLVAHNTRNL